MLRPPRTLSWCASRAFYHLPRQKVKRSRRVFSFSALFARSKSRVFGVGASRATHTARAWRPTAICAYCKAGVSLYAISQTSLNHPPLLVSRNGASRALNSSPRRGAIDDREIFRYRSGVGRASMPRTGGSKYGAFRRPSGVQGLPHSAEWRNPK